MKIQLPTKKGTPNTNPIIEFKQLVIVGANGAGKTRFGSRIEETYLRQTHRISAQKSLSFPIEVSPKSTKRAESELHFGYFNEGFSDDQNVQQKRTQRWGGKINTFLLNDYDKLMVLLHTDQYEQALNYMEGRTAKPLTKLDRVQKIWEQVLPHRKLLKKAGIIETYPKGVEQNKYNAAEMSDGERVIFYLIGEVICAPSNSIMIIDEPEMHIHKSLVKKLFDLIENERKDCSFVYLTHDIDFASSRQNAVKIWAKSYEGSNIWDYEILDETYPIPEQLYLEVLGSRKPIIFIEGDSSSIDYRIYEQVYLDYTLKPLGNCEKVIQSVKSFNDQKTFHHLDCYGIIDRDRRNENEIKALVAKNIWVLDVAEAENLLLLETVIKSVASHMGKNPEEVFDKVKSNIIEFFKEQLESQIISHFKEILRRKITSLANFSAKNISEAISEINTSYTALNAQEIFDPIKHDFEAVITNSDYEYILKIFNLKNALIPKSKVCELTGIKNQEEYLKIILTLLKKQDANSDIIKKAISTKVVTSAA